MTYKHNHSLYEVQGKTKDDGRIYDSTICLKCGGYVAYLPTAKCGDCGYLESHEHITVREDMVSDVREAIKKAELLLADPRTDEQIALDEWQNETEATRMSDYPI